MWPNSNRRQRHTGKHGGSIIERGLAPVGGLAADALAPAQAGMAELCSGSTLAWLRSEREIALGSAADNHNQAMQLLELEKIELSRAADLDQLLARLSPAGPAAQGAVPGGEAPEPTAFEQKHWTDGAWQPLCGELSGTVAQSRDTVTCPSCTEQLGNPPVGAPTAVDTGELSRYFEQPQQSVATGLWQPPAAAQQFPQSPQIDLPGVLAAAKDGAQRLAAVTTTPPWRLDDAPLYGHLATANDGQTRELASVDGAA